MICPLCRKAKTLCKSHIVPEFFYKPGYDENHRIQRRLNNGTPPKIVQKGLKFELLCRECEKLLNQKYEQPYAKIWDQMIPDKPSDDVVVLTDNGNFKKLKLLHLSILWRASVCRDAVFSHVNLGSRHEEKIKQMILEEIPVLPNDYPVMGEIITSTRSRTIKGMVTGFDPQKALGGHRCYAFFYGGCAWWVIVSSHSIGQLNDNFLGYSQKLELKVTNFQQSALLASVISELST